MKSMNLSKFKKIASDKKTTTLEHPSGHQIKIAHSALKPEIRETLNNLPMHKASGGMVKKYANGADPVSDDDQNSSSMPAADSFPTEQPKPVQENNTLDNALRFAQTHGFNDSVDALLDWARTDKKEEPVATQGPTGPAQTSNAQMAAPAPQVDAQRTPAQDQQEIPSDQVAQSQPAQPPMSGVDKTEDSQSVGAPQQAAPPSDYQKSYQDYVQAHQKEFAEQDAAFAQDLQNGHITPKTYHDLFASKSTLGKIGMIFGMLASGAGSGLAHQPNAMLGMMNNEIQNDLESQKQSKSNAQNLIKLNQMHQLNQAQVGLTGSQAKLANAEANTKAAALSNMQANRIALDKIANQVKNLPVGSPERAQQEQALGMMYNAVNNENFNIGSRAAAATVFYSTLMGHGGAQQSGSEEQAFQQKTNGMRMLGPQGQEMAKNAEEKHFPGIKGQASVPLSTEDRNSINSGIEFDQKLHRFMDWTKNHSGDLNPADKNAGQAMAAELQGAYRQATHGGVYKEGEQNFISKVIDSDPTKFFNSIRVMPQLKIVANENESRLNQLVKSKGFQGYASPQAQSGGGSSGTSHSDGDTGVFKGKPVVFQNGKWTYK